MPSKDIPAYLFLGEEGFLKEEAIEKLKAKYLEPETKDLNFSVFYANDKDFRIDVLLDSLNTAPFIAKRRLVVLKDADFLVQSQQEAIISYLRNPNHASLLIIESPSSSIKGGFLLEASKLAQLVYCRRLSDASLDVWLIKKAASFGKKISGEAIGALKASLPNDLKMFSFYIEHLSLYAHKRPLITKEDAEKVVGPSLLHAASDIMDTIAKNDVNKAMRIFHSSKKDKGKHVELLGLIAWNARMVLRARELMKIKSRLEIMKELSLAPRNFERIIQQASSLNRTKILGLLKEILKSDVDIKTGMRSSAVIEKLIVKMCS